jgi:hypothetical protein
MQPPIQWILVALSKGFSTWDVKLTAYLHLVLK